MEGDAGTSQLNPTDAEDTPDKPVAVSPDDTTEFHDETTPGPDSVEESATTAVGARPSRLGRGCWLTICTVLLLLTAGATVGSYLAL
ncbi:MAG: hypothetical protein VYB90_13175, partial [Actinomycetota bacterium]|nr:hypothetical protein [Actinomycetota bacterium]